MIDLCTDKKHHHTKIQPEQVSKILVSPPYMVLKKEKLSKYIEKKKDNTNHAAELNNAPGRISFVLKFSLGRKRYIMMKTIINVKNASKNRIAAKKTCLFSSTGSNRYN